MKLLLLLLAVCCFAISLVSSGLLEKRQTSVEGHANKDSSGTHVGGSVNHKSGSTSVGAHVDHSNPGGTSYGVHASHTWSHSGGSKTTVSGGFDHSSHGGNSGGLSVTHHFGKRMARLEEAVRDMERRQTKVHFEKDKNGNTHLVGESKHTSKDGKTKAEAHFNSILNGRTSYGGSLSHDFGSTFVSGKADHGFGGDDSFGLNARHKWTHPGGSKTTFSGMFDHNSQTGNSFGVGFSHTFGKRMARLEQTVRDVQRRQLTFDGHANKDKYGGLHLGGGVDYKFNDAKAQAEAHAERLYNDGNKWTSYRASFRKNFGSKDNGGFVGLKGDHGFQGDTTYGLNGGYEWNTPGKSKATLSGMFDHNSKTGNYFGVGFKYQFGKRMARLEQAVRDVQRRQTTVHGHADKDKNGNTHVGGGVEHTSKDGKTHTEGHVDHSSNGGTSYGGSFSHTFGKRMARLEEAVMDMERRQNGGYAAGLEVDHGSGGNTYRLNGGYKWKDGKSLSATYRHNSKTGNFFGVSFKYDFRKRMARLEQAVRDVQRRQTTVHGHADKDKHGDTHVGGGVEHTSKDGKTHTEGHVDHSSNGGTSYGGSFSHTFGKRMTRRHA